MGLSFASSSLASEAPTGPPASTKLKWRMRPAKVERPAEVATASQPAPQPVEPASVPQRKREISGRTSRSKTRDAVMQVSTFSDPDPFGDKAAAKPEEKQEAEAAKPIIEDEPTLPKDEMFDSEPSPLPGPSDRLPEDRSSEDAAPRPPSSTAPLPQGDVLEPDSSAPNSALSCDNNRADCMRGIADLQARGITTIKVGLLIEGTEGEDFPCECKLGREFAPAWEGRHFAPVTFAWKATGVCHKPLYFEDVQLERYGHSWNPVLQPVLSGAHFFASVALWPYHMGLTPPHECIYTLGYYRPGSCAPYMIEAFPLSVRAGLSEAFALTGFAFMLWP
jgi:hypothetical protein